MKRDRADTASDEALMMCVQSGDGEALQELMTRHEKKLFNFLARFIWGPLLVPIEVDLGISHTGAGSGPARWS